MTESPRGWDEAAVRSPGGHVLQSAAWWAARNTGKVPDAMIEGARFLADRRGWPDVLWVVQRVMATP